MPLKLRDPRELPEAGDVLFYQKWRVEVTGRAGELVQYVKSKGKLRAAASQSLDVWRAWTPASTVRLRGASGCTKSAFASGPCVSCRKLMSGPVHITPEGVKCDDCCSECSRKRPRAIAG